MSIWIQLLGIASALLIAYFLYREIKGNPDRFTKKQLNESVYTMGLLALALIAVIAICVLFLKT